MTAYAPPEWALNGVNPHHLGLEVIKSGVIVEKIQLEDKSHFVAGRMEPLCDIVLQHPSVSRTHAALQFDGQGQLYIYDMGSTHGTYVNKRRIPSRDYLKINVGDVLVFGESTRIYTVLGPSELMPEEYSSTNLTKMRHKLEERRQTRAAIAEKEDEGATWGFGEDAVNESDSDSEDEKPSTTKSTTREGIKLPDYLRNRKDDTPYVSTVTKDTINPTKDNKLFTRLQARIQKMENLKMESKRIRVKQNVGLTDGQQAALDRNEARIRELEDEIENLEAQLLAKHSQRTAQQASAMTAKKKKAYVDSDEDDDFYDRTKNQPKPTQSTTLTSSSSSKKVLTMESITAELKTLREQLATAEAIVASTSSSLTNVNGNEEEDSLEAYMQQSNTALAAQDQSKALAEIARLTQLISQQEKLQEIATPAWAKVKATEEIPQAHIPTASIPSTDKPTTNVDVAKAQASPNHGAQEKIDESTNEEEPSALIVPPLSSYKDDIPPRHESYDDNREVNDESDTRKRSVPEVNDQAKRVRRRKEAPKQQAPAPTKKVYDNNVLEGGDVVWAPPKNQTGDGRTALNDKYGY